MLSTPDVTPAQIGAWAAAIVSIAVVLFKLNLTDDQQGVIVAAIVGVVTAVHLIADAIIRHGRATGLGATLMPVSDAPTIADGNDSTIGPRPNMTPAPVGGNQTTKAPKR